MKKLLLLSFALFTGNLLAQLPVSTAPQNKKAVLEEFTGIHCGYCPDGHRIGTQIYNADPTKVILVNIHSGSFANASAGEPDFKTPEGNAIDAMPGMGITGYPAGNMNREVLVGSVMAASRGSWTSMANTIKSQAAYCNVALQGTLDPQTRVLTVDVEVYYTSNSPVATNSLNVFLLESKIAGPQSNYGNYNPDNYNADGTYNHNHLLRKALSPTFGQTIPNTTSGSLYTTTLTYTIPATYGAAGKTTIPKFENLEIIAFVTQSDRKVINADDGPIVLTNDASAITAELPVVCQNTFAPVVKIENTGASAITNLTITPSVDGAIGAATSWSGNLLPGAFTLITLNSISSGTANGNHLFTYTITGVTPSDFYTNNNSFKTNFFSAFDSQGTPVAEGFLLAAFPPAGWGAVNTDQGGGSWIRNSQTGGYWQTPMNSVKYDFYSNKVIGDVDALHLPSMDLSGTSAPDMSFDYAYAQRTSSSNDRLDVLVSDDCGNSWTNVWSKSGASLATAVNPVTAIYLPNPAEFTEWQTAIISLTGYNKNNVLVKFQTTNDNGNNLYIDNVNLSQKSPTPNSIAKNASSSLNLSVYPNPAGSLANLSISADQSGSTKISVINTLGQTVYQKNTDLNGGLNTIAIDVKEFANGIYYVVVDTATGSTTKKLTVSK